MLRGKVLIGVFTTILLSNIAISAQKKCMFVGASTTGDKVVRENAGYDKHIMPLIEAWGYVVDKKHECGDVLEYTAADFEPYDFIFLSESVHTSRIGESLRKIYKPMLCAEAMGTRHEKLGFATGGNESAGLYHPGKPAQILASVNNHPLAAGYAAGTEINFGDYSTKNSCLMTWGMPTIDVIPIAAMKNNQKQLVAFGIEKGTKNSHGETINHRVAVVGTHAWCYRPEFIGEPLIKLMKAGIEWVLESQTAAVFKKSVAKAPLSLSCNNRTSLRTITFSVPEKSLTRLTVWNGLGQKISTLVNDVRSAGEHTVNLDATNMPGGMYLVNLESGTAKSSKRVLFTN